MYYWILLPSRWYNMIFSTYLNKIQVRPNPNPNLAIELFKGDYFEEKEIAIRMLNKRVKLKNKLQTINEKHLSLLGETVFNNNNIKTWATCDHFVLV